MSYNTHIMPPPYSPLAYILAFVPWCILPFSPIATLLIALSFLYLLTFLAPSAFLRIVISLAIIISGAITYGNNTPCYSDALNYYTTYHSIARGDFSQIFAYGSGVEFLMPLYWCVISFFFDSLRCVDFLILNSICAGILTLIWLEKYALKDTQARYATLCVFFVFCLFSFWTPTFLTRQLFACIFILFALYQTSKYKTLIFVLLGFFCHTTAILFYVLFYCFRHYFKLSIIITLIVSLMIASSSLFPTLISNMKFIPDFLSHKLLYYDRVMDDAGRAVLKDSVFVCVLMLLTAYYYKNIDPKWRNIIIFYGILFLVSPIASWNFSIRVGLFYHVIFGFLFFKTLENKLLYLYILAFVLLIDRFRTMIKMSILKEGFYDLDGGWFYYLFN
ncbi:EpsG family protein [uncultured Helicobacter sp.]|uniref:EpsG family protein n=1 Tax=uncultured Helicobacter sp. TaxID=175537 RepID=UPI00374FC0ED